MGVVLLRPPGDAPLFRSWVGGRFSGWEEAEAPSWSQFSGLLAKEEVMQDLFKTLWRDDSGQDTTEYVLLVLLVALAVTAGMLVLATSINNSFDAAGGQLDAAAAS